MAVNDITSDNPFSLMYFIDSEKATCSLRSSSKNSNAVMFLR
jgi:hypothetical protein